MKPLLLFSLYLVFEHCMDSALRSSLPHLTRWFNTVLGQKEVKEVMEGLDLKQSLPKVAPVVECGNESSPGNVSKGAPASVAPATALGSSGKGRCLSPPLQSIWQQNSQACFFCFDYIYFTNILKCIYNLNPWHRDGQDDTFSPSYLTFTHHPLLCYNSRRWSLFCLVSLCTSLRTSRSCDLNCLNFRGLPLF